jgi:hypothetical protein
VLVAGQGRQAIDILFSGDDDAPAIPAVAAVRSAPGNLKLMAETHAAIAAVPSFDKNRDPVEKHGMQSETAKSVKNPPA